MPIVPRRYYKKAEMPKILWIDEERVMELRPSLLSITPTVEDNDISLGTLTAYNSEFTTDIHLTQEQLNILGEALSKESKDE